MPLRDDLLLPIPGDNPSGNDLRYTPLFDQIREARRYDDPELAEKANTGQGSEPKKADYRRILSLTQEALATKSKDLRLAVWLAEAMIYQEQFAGLAQGLDLLGALIDKFWDHLYPELEDGDAELRATPLEWFGNYFEPVKGSSPAFAVRLVPLNKWGYNWVQQKEAQKSGADELEKAFADTPKLFYRSLDNDLRACCRSLDCVDELCQARFGTSAPSFSALRSALSDVSNLLRVPLQRKLAIEPDPVEPPPGIAIGGDQDSAISEEAEDQLRPVASEAGTAWQPLIPMSGRDEAIHAVIAAACYLLRDNPGSPIPYLLLRALRWGELRGASDEDLNRLLESPPPELRINLKSAAKAANWKRVLDVAEEAMCAPWGRGWLDLQRYTITACEHLKHETVARCLRSELRLLLTDLPNLVNATLLDDTGAANPDTLAWLRQGGFIS